MGITITEIQKIESDMLKEVVRLCNENNLTYYGAYGTVLGAIRHQGCIPWDGDVDIYIPENELELFINVMESKLNDNYWVHFRHDGEKQRDFPRIGYKGFDTEVIHIDVFRLTGAPSNVFTQHLFRRINGIIHNANNLNRNGFDYYKRKKNKKYKAILGSIFTRIIPFEKTSTWIDSFGKKYPFETSEYVEDPVSNKKSAVFPKRLLGNGVIVPYDDFYIRIPEFYDEYLSFVYGDYMKYPSEDEIQRGLNLVYNTRNNPDNNLYVLYREKNNSF